MHFCFRAGHTYLTVYIRNFLSPIEQVLLEQGQERTVQTIRDALMKKLLPEIKAYIKKITERDLVEFYYDWNFQQMSGLLLGISSTPFFMGPAFSEEYEGKETLHREMYLHHEHVHRKPTKACWCSAWAMNRAAREKHNACHSFVERCDWHEKWSGYAK
ncbi:DUF2294 family protein [Brevibacillus composti]|uniref:DUF2294 family protein n=1 Tax=Brevibacillus composti TaxID=2796470 RepID=A0A7T5EPY8_9BACL|nr:Na-translocating system protein MpsC family protein [Brevibacillus composti]QQE76595.1 DUF2294 family protein [Brevibacillus composti]QUO43668.1 DUF2294 family protein [Brevibacillus composti]